MMPSSPSSSSSRRFWAGFLVGSVSFVTVLYLSGWRIVPRKRNVGNKSIRSSKRIKSIEELEEEGDCEDDIIDYYENEEEGSDRIYSTRNQNSPLRRWHGRRHVDGTGTTHRSSWLPSSMSPWTASSLWGSTDNSSSNTRSPRIYNNFFLSDIVKKLWKSHIDTIASTLIRESIDPMFASMLPGPLATTRFTKFSLGNNPVKLENVLVVPEEDEFEHDYDGGDSIRREINSYSNHRTSASTSTTSSTNTGGGSVVKFYMDVDWEADCDIQLKADYVGTFGIQSLSIKAKLVVVLHPTPNRNLPIISAVEYSLVNPPEIDFELSGLAQLADNLKVVKTRMLPILQDSLASMVVLPYRMLRKLDPTVRYWEVYTPVRGIARITLLRGRGFSIKNLLFGRKDVPDVHCTVSLGSKMWNSSTIDNACEPEWNETCDFLWNDPEQQLVINAYDHDDGALGGHEHHLGVAQVTIRDALPSSSKTLQRKSHSRVLDVELTNRQKNQTGEEMVTVSIELLPLVLTEESHDYGCSSSSLWNNYHNNNNKANQPQRKEMFEPNQIRGLMEIMVLGAHDLPFLPTSTSTTATNESGASTFVKVTCGKHEFYTSTATSIVDPPIIYDGCFLVPIEDPDDLKCDIVFTIYSTTNTGTQTILGTHTVKNDVLKRAPRGIIVGEKQPITAAAAGGKGGGESLAGATIDFCVVIRVTQDQEEDDDSDEDDDYDERHVVTNSIRSRGGCDGSSSRSRAGPSSEPIGKVRLTAVKGWGFKEQRSRFRKRLDIPDIYCSIKLGSSSAMWRTATIWNNPNPEWNESIEFPLYLEGDEEIVMVYVYDDNEAKPGVGASRIGEVRVRLADLLAKTPRAVDLPVKAKKGGKGPTVGFIALRAELV